MQPGEPACGLLDAELALDRLEAALALELPAHVRAFAATHAAKRPSPPPPPSARRPASLAIARRALAHPELEDRALVLVRLLAPIAIDEDPAVTAALAANDRDWSALAGLVRARDHAARSMFGLRFIELVHALHGSRVESAPVAAMPPVVEGWSTPSAAPVASVEELWHRLAAIHGVQGAPRIVRAEARPRAFVVEPGREVIVVVPAALATPAERFAVLHELGHALAGLLVSRPLPRVVDEAVASYVARAMETDEPIAIAARSRRALLARSLADVELALPAIEAVPTPRPPWALWHDSGVQAAYVIAETLADRWWHALGEAPPPAALASAIRAACADVDRASTLR